MSRQQNDFVASSSKGRVGEKFVLKHLNQLINDPVIDVTDTAAKKISGKELCFDYKQLSAEDKVWLEEVRHLPTGTRIIRVHNIPDWCMPQISQFRIKRREAENKARREKYARQKGHSNEP